MSKGSKTHHYNLCKVQFSIYGCLAPKPNSQIGQSPLLEKYYNLHPLTYHHNQSHHLCHLTHAPHSPFGPSSQAQPPSGTQDQRAHHQPPS